MNKKVIGIILVVVLLLVVAGYYFYNNSKIIAVNQVKPENNIVEKTVSASGKVISDFDAELSFASTGKITSMNVKEGDIVKKGQLLAALNSDSSRSTAQALKDSRDAIIRDRDLFIKRYADDQNDVGGKEEYNLQLRKLNEQVSQANASYAAQTSSFKNFYIYAPFEGTVVNVSKETGETASLGETIVEVADLSKLKFEAEVDQEDFGLLKEGQISRISFDAFDTEEIGAVINKLPDYVSSNSNSTFFKVTSEITDTKSRSILLGMEGDIEIIVDSTEKPVLTLVFDEVFKDTDGKTYVWILTNDSKLKKNYIEVGLEGDLFSEIKNSLDGLKIVSPSTTTQKFEESQPAKIIVKG